MRAICGAIITAGALIGLGLTAVGVGIRYQDLGLIPSDEAAKGVFYGTPSLMICMVTTVVGTLVGLAVAFLGLMYHHERRYRELHGEVGYPAEARTPVGTSRVSV